MFETMTTNQLLEKQEPDGGSEFELKQLALL